MLKGAPRSTKSWGRRLRSQLVTMWQRTMNQDGAPHRVALGAAIGFLIGWLPIMGIQMLVALGVCLACRANFPASIPGVWLSNPVTVLPMYWIANQVGAVFAGTALSWDHMQTTFGKVMELGAWDGSMLLFTELWWVTVAMFIGGFIIGGINGIAVYPIVLRMVRQYQHRRERRRTEWRILLRKLERESANPQSDHVVTSPSSQSA